MDDLELLQRYVRHHSEDAFADLVSRHINMVYSVALRQVGNAHQAEEITQAVFIILARKSASLGKDTVLSGWLYRTTRLTAGHCLRAERRRIHREQEAYMHALSNEPEPELWEQIGSHLEDAIDSLRDKERNAIVLRFLQSKSLREVGLTLGTNEDAAQKTVSRAVEKLRAFFSKRGIQVSGGVLASTISAHALQAAPAELAALVTTAAVCKGAAAGALTLTLVQETLRFMIWHNIKTTLLGIAALSLSIGTGYFAFSSQSASAGQPPLPRREFRGVWVATVANIDWPSRPNLNPAEQKAELTAIMDKLAELNCNAIVFQVRPGCDALYQSKIEPWSEYLTGQMGKSPGYDPLEFAIAEAHQRGLELHAWFNPYRARLRNTSPAAPNHISRKRPDLVRAWGESLWLDPAEPDTRAYSLSVIEDVVRRYDIDGVHFDDYFYPYKEGNNREFPDDAAWQRYQAGGGTLSRGDWRRSNVNEFIQSVQKMVRREKAWVKFGISPFGIWQPGHPSSVRGLNAYEELYADSRLWLSEGWVDYLAPQLYWPIAAPQQSFPALLQWWTQQNPKERHLWPGMNVMNQRSRAGEEVAAEIAAIRKQAGASGNVLWHSQFLMTTTNGIAEALAKTSYQEPALIPACPWLGKAAMRQPTLELKQVDSGLEAHWATPGTTWLWVLQIKTGKTWQTRLLPGDQLSQALGNGANLIEKVALTAVNRFGDASAPVVVSLKKSP